MEDITLFKTKRKANYFYSSKRNQFLLIHPVLYGLLSLHKKKIDVGVWLENLKEDPVNIGNHGAFSREEVIYYYKKYELLFNNGYLENVDTAQRISGRLTGGDIKSNVANTRSVVFEVTEACNLKCEYCGYGKFYNDYGTRTNKYLSIKTAKHLLNYLADFWNSPLNKSHNKEIHLGFYGGEPLLHFSFIKDIVGYVKTLKLAHNFFSFGVTTNAMLLGKHIDFLVDNDFKLLISLDGNEENNGYRVLPGGGEAYRAILRNVEILKRRYPGYFENRVDFASVLHNKNSVSDIVGYFKDTFNKIPFISELNTTGIAPEKKDEFWKTYKNYNESLNQIEDYSVFDKNMFLIPDTKITTEVIMEYSGNIYKNFEEFYFSNDDCCFIPTATCLPFSRKIFVTANGKILPCERIGHQFALGFVAEDDVDINFDRIADRYNRYFDKIGKYCNTCFRTKNCRQCIFNLNIDDEKPVCHGYTNEKDFSAYLSANLSYLEDHPEIYKKIMGEVIAI